MYTDNEGDLWYSVLDEKNKEILFKNDRNGRIEYMVYLT